MNYKIQELALLSSVSTRTLRYYESLGLIKPIRDAQSNYRLYGSNAVNTLQRILFFKELGLPLKAIKTILSKEESVIQTELTNHLAQMQCERQRIDTLIHTIENTLKTLKGEMTMRDSEKFEGFKKALVQKNNEQYEEEVIIKYGKDAHEQSNKALLNMSEETFDRFQTLSEDIIKMLLTAYKEGSNPSSVTAQKAAKAHQEWISLAWGYYSEEAHIQLVDMYLSDPRFQAYYDDHQPGLCQLLHDAVYHLLLQG